MANSEGADKRAPYWPTALDDSAKASYERNAEVADWLTTRLAYRLGVGNILRPARGQL